MHQNKPKKSNNVNTILMCIFVYIQLSRETILLFRNRLNFQVNVRFFFE